MKRRALAFTGVWIVAAFMLAACSKGGDALTKAGFITKGDAVCVRTQKAIDDGADKAFPNKGLVPTAAEVGAFVKDTLKPELRKEISELDDLKPPKSDQRRVDDILAAGRRGLTAVDDNPVILLGGESNPLNEYAELASAYGLKACGANSDDTARKLAGLK